jgi:1-acyl-sn-glycerol-3-phosphate acyltransferase
MKPAALLSARLLFHLVILRPTLKLFFGVNVEGRENFSGLEHYIVAANHNSHLDILLLYHILPVRHILKSRPVAAGDYFSKKPFLYRLVSWLFRPVWITRGEQGAAPLEKIKELLVSGHNIIIFPEGTRGVPGRIGKFKSGIGKLAEACADVPTLPVFLSGPEKALPKESAVPLPIYNQVTIGPPRSCIVDAGEFTASVEAMIHELARSETANRHRRIKRERKPLTIAVLGIDGSGKSTVSRRIARSMSCDARVCLVSDRLEFFEGEERKGLQPLPSERLRQALGRYAKTAKSLKHYKIPKLAELLLRDHLMEQIRRWYAPEIIVLDGSPLINLTAWARLYKKEGLDTEACFKTMRVMTGRDENIGKEDDVYARLPELAALKRLRLACMELPSAVVMLDVDPAVAMGRIQRRGETMQVHETEEKLARLREGYLMVCDVVSRQFGIPTSILDGNSELDEVTDSALQFAGGRHHREQDLDPTEN